MTSALVNYGVLIALLTYTVDTEMKASIDDYFHEGAAEVSCTFTGAPVGDLIVLYPPWTGTAGSDRCAYLRLEDSPAECKIQNSCNPSVPPNHGEYSVTNCRIEDERSTFKLTMRISGGDPANSGTLPWTCAVYTGGSNPTNSDIAKVNLWQFTQTPAPKITDFESEGTVSGLTVKEAVNKSLTCTVGGTPAPRPTLTWYRQPPSGDREPLASAESVRPDQEVSLLYEPFREHMGHTLYCEASQSSKHSSPEQSTKLELNIQYGAEFTAYVQNISVLATDNTTLSSCSFEGNPAPNVTLDEKTGILAAVYKTGDFNGTVEMVWGTDDIERRKRVRGMSLNCRASNLDGQAVSNTFSVDVMFAPGTPSISIPYIEWDVKRNVTLSCEDGAEGNPPASQYTWYKDGDSLATSTQKTTEIRLNSVQQEGNYSCSSSNSPPSYQRQNSSASADKELIVNVPPEILSPASVITVIRNHTSRLSVDCVGVAKPDLVSSQLSWLLPPGAQTGYNSSLTSALSSNAPYGLTTEWKASLQAGIPHLQCAEVASMDGVYRCNASGVISEPIHVETQHPALWSGRSYNPIYKAAIGENISLACEICSNPDATVTWSFSGDPLTDSPTSSILVLPSVTREQYGNYTCVAGNLLGATDFPLSLVAEGPPLPPENLTVAGAFSRGVDLQWVAGFDGGVPDMLFEVAYARDEWMQVGEEGVPEGSVVNVTVDNLAPDTAYTFRVQAKNSFRGRSLSNENIITHRTKVAPEVRITSLRLFEDRVRLTWNLTAGEISSLSLGHKISTESKSADNTTGGYVILVTGIGMLNQTIDIPGAFDLDKVNQFVLFVFESGRGEYSDQTPEGDGIYIPVSPPGASAGLIAGIVIGVIVVIAIIVVVLFVVMRNKIKNEDQRKLSRPNNTMPVPSSIINQAYSEPDRNQDDHPDIVKDLYAIPIPKKDRRKGTGVPSKSSSSPDAIYENASNQNVIHEAQLKNVENLNYAQLEFDDRQPQSSNQNTHIVEYAIIDYGKTAQNKNTEE